jgi:hypothetical protein
MSLMLLACGCNAAEPQNENDRWFSVNAVGFHHHGTTSPISISNSDAEKYFTKAHPFLSATFENSTLRDLLKEIAGQEFKPKRSVPLRDPRCFAEVSRINKQEVYIKILKPLGAWRWHHHFQCLAIYKIQRNKAIDDIFAIDKLYAKLSFTFQGIGHGMAGPDIRSQDSVITKALGEPTFEYPSQSPSLGRYYYEKHDLHIVTHEFVVYYVEKGKPDWVEYVKEERESNKELKATDKSAL